VRWSAALADPAGPREFWAQRRVCLLGTVRAAPEAVGEAERRHAHRYRQPRPNPRWVVIEMAVESVTGRW
jgi:hypothetical protein